MFLIRFTGALVLFAVAAGAADPVLWASRREGWIEAFRLDNLETAARLRVPERVEGVESAPDGQRLFVRAPHPQQPDICCALFVLDVRTLRAFAIIWPAFFPAQANGKLFVQRGDDGIEGFDTRSLMHLPILRVPGVYQLAPSPDGRWLFGTRQFPTPGLDIFDLAAQKMVRQIPAERGQYVRGVWLGPKFYLFASDLPGAGRFSSVDPQAGATGPPRLVRLGNPSACPEPDYALIAAGDRVVVYSPLSAMPPRIECLAGGYVLADPAAGEASKPLAPGLHFVGLVAGGDGKFLYGIAASDDKPGGMRLVKLDAASGQKLAARDLPSDIWHLTLGEMPAEWEGRLDLKGIFQ
jgi:hypothetical protein